MEHDTGLKTVGEREGGQGSDLVLLLVGMLYLCAPFGWAPPPQCSYWLGCYTSVLQAALPLCSYWLGWYTPVLLLVRLLYPCSPIG